MCRNGWLKYDTFIIVEEQQKQGTLTTWMMSDGCRIDIREERCPTTNIPVHTWEQVSLIPVLMILCEHLRVLSMMERWMMKSSMLFECRRLPHMSTRRHSCDKCSQSFPIFHHSSTFCLSDSPCGSSRPKQARAWFARVKFWSIVVIVYRNS